MDISSPIWWLSELEMDDPATFHDQYQMNNIDQEYLEYSMELPVAANSFTSETYSAYPSFTTIPEITSCKDVAGNSRKQLKLTNYDDAATSKALAAAPAPSHLIISFGKSEEEYIDDDSILQLVEDAAGRPVSHSISSRTPSQAQDHLLSERRRRERMAQQFVALSALIPNMKKKDKCSVLREAMKYIKELRGHVKELEGEQHSWKDVESIVSNKRSRSSTWSSDGDYSSSGENSPYGGHCQICPEIEVRVSGTDVLVKIHCEKQTGLIVKVLNEIQKQRLSIISSSAMPFGESTLLINIVAQMEDEFFVTATELAKKLHLVIAILDSP